MPPVSPPAPPFRPPRSSIPAESAANMGDRQRAGHFLEKKRLTACRRRLAVSHTLTIWISTPPTPTRNRTTVARVYVREALSRRHCWRSPTPEMTFGTPRFAGAAPSRISVGPAAGLITARHTQDSGLGAVSQPSPLTAFTFAFSLK